MRIDPNRASPEALAILPGIGPVRARAIAAARRRGQVFRSPADLMLVPGIAQTTAEGLRPYLRFSAAAAGESARGAR